MPNVKAEKFNMASKVVRASMFIMWSALMVIAGLNLSHMNDDITYLCKFDNIEDTYNVTHHELHKKGSMILVTANDRAFMLKRSNLSMCMNVVALK